MKIWTNWPLWLRAGVIAGGLAFLSARLTNFCESFFDLTPLGLECLPLNIPWIPFWFLPRFTSLPTILYEIVGVGVWFTLGAIICTLIRRNRPIHSDYSK